jgi:hypothetical protein
LDIAQLAVFVPILINWLHQVLSALGSVYQCERNSSWIAQGNFLYNHPFNRLDDSFLAFCRGMQQGGFSLIQ